MYARLQWKRDQRDTWPANQGLSHATKLSASLRLITLILPDFHEVTNAKKKVIHADVLVDKSRICLSERVGLYFLVDSSQELKSRSKRSCDYMRSKVCENKRQNCPGAIATFSLVIFHVEI